MLGGIAFLVSVVVEYKYKSSISNKNKIIFNYIFNGIVKDNI